MALTNEEKRRLRDLANELPPHIVRADVPDLAVAILAARLEALHQAVADRNREIPEGVTDFDSLYLLWDLPLPPKGIERKWTSIRLSPQESIELGRVQGTLNAAYGTTRSDTFSLGLALLTQYLEDNQLSASLTLIEIRNQLISNYL
ncbi:MAG: hypothetical protein M5U34_20805 [Chloroflexi bacterium]|nr:hypothetical protein [Chloroflexota bacterium]